jgi:hypothetical protein
MGAVSEQMEKMDKTTKTADKIGATTEGLGRLQFAGKLTGVQIEKTNMALQRMVRRIAEAAEGTGEAQGALKELGVDAQALAKLKAEDQFLAIADAMDRVQDQSQRVRLAFKLFDSEGVDLVNTLALGREGIERLGNEADRLGITFDRVDAAKIEMANDAITKMSAAWEGVKTQIAIDVAPLVTALSDKFVSAAVNGEDMGTRVGRVLDSLQEKAMALADVLDRVSLGGSFLASLGKSAAAIPLVIRQGLQKGVEAITGKEFESTAMVGKALEEIYKGVEGSLDNVARKTRKIAGRESQQKLSEFVKNAEKTADAAAKIRAGDAGAGVDPGAIALEERAKRLAELEKLKEPILAEIKTPQQGFIEQMSLLNEMLSNGVIGLDTYQKAASHAGNRLQRLVDRVRELRAALNTAGVGSAARTAFRGIVPGGASDETTGADGVRRMNVPHIGRLPGNAVFDTRGALGRKAVEALTGAQTMGRIAGGGGGGRGAGAGAGGQVQVWDPQIARVVDILQQIKNQGATARFA